MWRFVCFGDYGITISAVSKEKRLFLSGDKILGYDTTHEAPFDESPTDVVERASIFSVKR